MLSGFFILRNYTLVFNFVNNFDHTFEIVLLIRDADGNPTGKKKYFASDHASEICDFFNRFQGKPKIEKHHDN